MFLKNTHIDIYTVDIIEKNIKVARFLQVERFSNLRSEH